MQLSIFPLDNTYRLVRTLGEGGFGRVWLAEDVLIAGRYVACLLYTSDAADERSSVDLGGRRIINKKKHIKKKKNTTD